MNEYETALLQQIAELRQENALLKDVIREAQSYAESMGEPGMYSFGNSNSSLVSGTSATLSFTLASTGMNPVPDTYNFALAMRSILDSAGRTSLEYRWGRWNKHRIYQNEKGALASFRKYSGTLESRCVGNWHPLTLTGG